VRLSSICIKPRSFEKGSKVHPYYGQIKDIEESIPRSTRAIAVFYGTDIIRKTLPKDYSELGKKQKEFLESYVRCTEGALSILPYFLKIFFWDHEKVVRIFLQEEGFLKNR